MAKEYIMKLKSAVEGTPPSVYEGAVSENIIYFGEKEEPKVSRIKSNEEFLISVETKNPLSKKQKDSLKAFYDVFEKIDL